MIIKGQLKRKQTCWLSVGTAIVGLAYCVVFAGCQNRPSSTQNKIITAPLLTTDTAKANALNKASLAILQISLDSSFSLAKQAKAISDHYGYKKGIGMALNNMATYYHNKGNYEKALQKNLQALELFEQLKDLAAQANTYVLMAQVYKEMSGNERTEIYSNTGIGYSRMAYKMYSTIKDTAGMVNSLSASGIIYRDKAIRSKKNIFYDSAFDVFSRAIALEHVAGKGNMYVGKLYNNISQVYTEERKDYKTALEYLFKAVQFNEQHNNLVSLSNNYGNISEVFIQQEISKPALLYAKKMLVVANISNRPSRISNACLQVYKAYQLSNQYDSALIYFVKATNLNDSLGNINKTSQVSELQTKYESEKKELMILELDTANANKTNSIGWLVMFLVVFISLSLGLVALYRRVQKQKTMLGLQAEKLELMMKELHHRVKNNLQVVSSLLSLQTYKMHDTESINALQASGQRVEAMSLIHQQLYKKDELTAVNIKEYITELTNSLLSSYGFQLPHFDLAININEGLMDVDKALPLGLIINELITNSLKYAYKNVAHPSLRISLLDNKQRTILSIKDNGQGFNEDIWNLENNSFGKQLITTLCKQLRAKLTLVTKDGTEFIIEITK